MNRSAKKAPTPPFRLEEFLPYRLSLLSNTVSQGIAQTYRQEFDLSVTEWRIIAVLGRYPGLTASAITQRTAMDKVAISRAVRRLEERGVVQRDSDPGDRRKAQLALTGRGKAIFREVVPRAAEYEQALLAALSQRQWVQLQEALRTLQDAAETLRSGD